MEILVLKTSYLKIRLYPTKSQETELEQILSVCRNVYNTCLNVSIFSWETKQHPIEYCELIEGLAAWNKDDPELSEVYAHVLHNVVFRADRVLKAFFQRVEAGENPDIPRSKGENYDSFTYSQIGFSLGTKSITFSQIGEVKAVVHRTLDGKLKTCTVRREGEKWFACFTVEIKPEPLPLSEEQIGVDMGLEKFAALSNGEFVANPRFLRQEEKTLAKAQRKLDKQQGRQEQQKAKKVVRRIHKQIANRRRNFIHQTARKLVKRFGVIAVEKLNVKQMQGNPTLAKSIADAGWSMFLRVLSEKAESSGRQLVEVNPAYTSQDCSGCGYRVKKSLSERWHNCPKCKLSLDRDANAARNILKIAVGLHSESGKPSQEALCLKAPGAVTGLKQTDLSKPQHRPRNVIRSETVLMRYPIHRLCKQLEAKRIEIKDYDETEKDKLIAIWQANYSTVYGQPGPLAYRVDTLIINRRIDDARKKGAIPSLLKLGSLREICREMGVNQGQATTDLKKALYQNAFAVITCKQTFLDKDLKKQTIEFDSTRYSIFFLGETLPNEKKADAVYIHLHEDFLVLLNSAKTRPLDYDYLKELSPTAQRFYELLSFEMYAAIKYRHRAKLTYSDFCTYAPQTRYFQYKRVNMQMKEIHAPHLKSEYIASVEYRETTDKEGRMDWEILYEPGPKAQSEYVTFLKKRDALETKQTQDAVIP